MTPVKRWHWIVVSLVALAGVAAWLILRPRAEQTVVDLVAELPNVVVSIPEKEKFSVIDVTTAGETRRSISFSGQSRLAWRVTVPKNAWLALDLAVTEPAWTVEGGGVLFRVTVYDEELLGVTINPNKTPTDRGWHNYLIDLSEYAGETIDVYLKTNTGPLYTCAWGAPRIITR